MEEVKYYTLVRMCTFKRRRYYRGDLGKTFSFPASLEVSRHFKPSSDLSGKAYENMSPVDLEILVNGRRLQVKHNEVGQRSKQDMIKALKKDDAWRKQMAGPGQGGAAPNKPTPYDEWHQEALIQETNRRKLDVAASQAGKPSVESLVDALKADDLENAQGSNTTSAPSLTSLKKDELINLVEQMELEVPPDATRPVLIELIKKAGNPPSEQ